MPLRALSMIALFLLVAGCASSSRRASAAGEVEPPRLLAPTRIPELQIVGVPPSGRDPIRVMITVEVDEAGEADLSTLRVTGRGGPENLRNIEQWLGNARFQPAMRDGEPVRGVFQQELRARVRVRRS